MSLSRHSILLQDNANRFKLGAFVKDVFISWTFCLINSNLSMIGNVSKISCGIWQSDESSNITQLISVSWKRHSDVLFTLNITRSSLLILTDLKVQFCLTWMQQYSRSSDADVPRKIVKKSSSKKIPPNILSKVPVDE